MSLNDWKEYRLGDFAEVQNGYAFKSSDFKETGIPVVKIKNIANSKIDFTDAQYYPADFLDKLKLFVIKTNDILISMTGSHINQIASAVGKVGKYQFDYPAFLNQRVGKIYIKNRKICNHDFLFYILNRFETQFELASSAGGSANQANISATQIKNLKVTLPPLQIQEHITSILSSLDEKIELNRQTAQTLEAITQALFEEWFVEFNFPGATGEMEESELGLIPRGWRVYRIGELVNSVSITHKFKKPQVIFLNTGDIEEGRVLHERYSDVNGLPGQAKKSIQKNDILFTEIRPANKRYALIAFDADDYVVSTKLMVLRCVSEVQAIVVYNYLTSNDILRELQHLAESRSGTFPQITFDQVKDLKLILPSGELLKKYEAVAWSIFNQIKDNEEQTKTLTQLRDGLLPKLMSGEIKIPN